MNKNNSLAMSGILNKTVHGIEIHKMPLRAYMQFAAKGGQLMPVILDKLFPGMTSAQILANALTLNREGITQALTQVFLEAPQIALEAIAELIGVDASVLLDNPQIGPGELWDILDAWREVNDLTDFFGRVSRLFPRP